MSQLVASYDYRLVALSVGISTLASYAAFDLAAPFKTVVSRHK